MTSLNLTTDGVGDRGSPAPDEAEAPGPPQPPEPAGEEPTLAQTVAFVLRSTQQRPQTEFEIRGKLSGRGASAEVQDAAIAQASDLGALDDAAFARAWVADRGVVRGYGVARLQAELRRRGVPDELAQHALAVLDERDEMESATKLARAKAGRMANHLDPQTVARRLVGYLVRRGYDAGVARRVAISVSALDREWD